jgi:hypothetical protein
MQRIFQRASTLSDSPHAVTRRLRAAIVTSLVVLVLTIPGCARRSSVTVPLRFRPTSSLKMGAFAGELPVTAVHVGPVNDARARNDAIGENLEEKKAVPVFAGGVEPAQFVRDTLRDLLSRAGLAVTPEAGGAASVLASDLHYFWTQETSTYEAEIRLTIAVRDCGGRQLWKGTINGTAERFGRSLKAENYQEVFSDAMVDLVQSLLGNAGFRDALKRAG